MRRRVIGAVVSAMVLGALPTIAEGGGRADAAARAAFGAAASADPTIAAAGDIACGASDPNYKGGNGTATACRQKYTSNLLVAGGYTSVLTLGDNMQSDPSPAGFATVYDPTWGRVKSITHPEAGNHDYGYSGAKGYYGYFGAAAGDPSKGYYSFDLGTWHVVALNSNCSKISGGCARGGAQEQWLRADLAAHPGRCTLAIDHHARYSSGHDGDNTFMTDLYQDLYDSGADLLLSGHSHDYERFAPQDNAAHLDASGGITQFVVGTGGAFFTGLGTRHANSAVSQNSTFGVLALTLHPTSYDWRFQPEAGKTWTDSGTRVCNSAATVAYTTTWTAEEAPRVFHTAAYLGKTPEEVQKTSVELLEYLLLIANPRPAPSKPTPPSLTGTVRYTTTWGPGEIGFLRDVQAQYSMTPEQTQKFATQFVSFLLALGGH